MSRFVVLQRFVRHRVAGISPRVAILRLSVMLVAGIGLIFGGIPEVSAAYLWGCEKEEYIDFFPFAESCSPRIVDEGKTKEQYIKDMESNGYFPPPPHSVAQEEAFNKTYKVSECTFLHKFGNVSSDGYAWSDRAICPAEPDLPPTISIAPGPEIEEGGTAIFTLTADPAPDEPLLVNVTIDQTGNFVPIDEMGEKTVTIDMTGSDTIEVETVVDAANDTDGSITVSVLSGNGYTGKPSASVEVKKVLGPISIVPISDTTGTVGKEFTVDVTIGGAGAGASLIFRAESSDSSIASVSPTGSQDWSSGSHVTVAPRKEGTATITVTVTDNGSLEATERFSVTVEPDTSSKKEEEEEAIQETVAAVAEATVSNVTSNIGARFSAPSTGSFSAPGTGGVLVRLAGMPVVLGSDDRNYPGSVSLADRVDAFGGDPWQPRQRSMSVDELLRTSSFEVTLGAAEGESGDAPGAGSRITVWGRGDLQFFESGGSRKSGYDGHLVAGYLGADIAMDGGWLAGVAVSRIAAEADYTLAGAGEGGSLEADLTNVHPYVRVAVDDRNEAWAIFGLGRGEVTDAPDGNGQEKSKSDLSMRMASAGLRHRLATDMGIDLALLGDGSFATIETDDGLQSVAGISSDVWRARLGVEASHTSVWESGSSLTSFLEVAGRRDGGDATEGWGLEVSPGLSFSDPGSGLSVEARIRALALHSVEDHDEYGASVTASLTPGADGLGLSMAVTPTWGAPETALGDADANLFGRPAADRGRDALSLNSRVAYGIAAGRGVVSPFAELSLHRNDSQQMRIGSRYSLGSAVDLELFGARSGHGSGDPEHSVGLTSRVHF